jgi:hypothetical protein
VPVCGRACDGYLPWYPRRPAPKSRTAGVSNRAACRQAQTDAGRQAQTEAGRQAQTEAGRQAQTEAGRQAQTEAGRQAQTEAGRQAQTEAGRQGQRCDAPVHHRAASPPEGVNCLL